MRTLSSAAGIIRTEILSGMQYRIAALSGSLISFFWGFIEITVLCVFYKYSEGGAAGASMTLRQSVSYIWLTQATFLLMATGIDPSIDAKIKSGDISIELCRPISIFARWYSHFFAVRIAPVILRGLPIIIAALLMGGEKALSSPVSLFAFLSFFAALAGSLILSASVAVFFHSVLLSLRWGTGPVNMMIVGSMVLSGSFFPLRLWPEFMQDFLDFQPFSGMLDKPIRLYIGVSAPHNLPSILITQLFWAVIFGVAGYLIIKRNIKRLEVQGG